nr:nucleoside-diphosphate kinase [Moorella mulderi]
MVVERTFAMIKPEGVERGLTGAIISRIELKGYRIVALKMLRITPELAARHYAEHQGKPFYQELISHITSGPVVAMVLEGPGVIAGLRQMMGATNPKDAAPGTIRGDYALEVGKNVIHGSDSPASAAREIALFFTPGELGEEQAG